MALTKCRECSAQISRSTSKCPQCGARRTTDRTLFWTALIGIGVFAWMFQAATERPTPARTSTSTASSEPAPDNKPPPSKPGDQWVVNSKQSPKDGSTNVFVRTVSGKPIKGVLGSPKYPMLYIVCRENTTNAYIDWDRFITTRDTRVSWRLDDKPLQRARWNMSTSNEATGLWSGGASIPFVKTLFTADRLRAWVTPHGENEIMADFDLTALRDKIEPLRNACHW
ncbi:type VI secretion system-associated protein TagO [Spectribacter hydrogenooxidans]|uniref:Type VI secretion system-associated protein TagO n=1 Tax=Spectribacter hydrogenoxidans TaxID=3075608 RepID=A0ABU3C0I3_9GAMM|nr:type VI secretion system-associated protein TagO [Salinisphaera sp. W335]MDT0635072.1 type VI secretion system-associated protein TagO [Salinisphaera sp. W335]